MVLQSRMPSPLTHRLLRPVRHKKASERTRLSTTSDVYVVGGYRDNDWDPDSPQPGMPFVPLAALPVPYGVRTVLDHHPWYLPPPLR